MVARALVPAAVAFIVVAVLLMIGGAIQATTVNVANNVTNNATLVGSLGTSTGNALTTFGNFLPIIAIAIVGGLAVGAIIQFGGFAGRG